MAKKPVVFAPILHDPVGINNYTGKVFRCFTKGDTLPFRFTITNADGTIPDITGWSVWIAFADTIADVAHPEIDQTLLEVEIPIEDLATGVFSGTVADSETNILPDGLVFASAKYVDSTGATRIIDMCQLEVYSNLTFASL